jgi:hypothetical protein
MTEIHTSQEIHECCICYATTEQHHKIVSNFCKNCNVHICCECWYEKCRTYCPICDRDILNKEKECFYCERLFHIKDIDACPLCNKRVCRNCEEDNEHECTDVMNIMTTNFTDIAKLNTYEEINEKLILHNFDDNIFRVIGIVCGVYFLTTDFNEDDIFQFSLTRFSNSENTRKNCDLSNRFKIGNCHIDYISFLSSHECIDWIIRHVL